MSALFSRNVHRGKKEWRVKVRFCILHVDHDSERVGHSVDVECQIFIADCESLGGGDTGALRKTDGFENASEIRLMQELGIRGVVGAATRVCRKLYPSVFVTVLRTQPFLVGYKAQPARQFGFGRVGLHLSISAL